MEYLNPRDYVRRPDMMSRTWTPEESRLYTRWLATSHYENFHVVSALLPKHLHQDFYNVYSFCRWADDLGDEIGHTTESIRLLIWWRDSLHDMYRGKATHPVFVALQPTVESHKLPMNPFDDLITAFVQDQTITRYKNWEELFGYCKNSANPVGRLVLGLCGYNDPERQRLSDATCTALQLANFWQDVTVDLKKDRVYIPLDVMHKHGYTVDELVERHFNPQFQDVMRECVEKARELFHQGLPLPAMLDRRLAFDIDLFSRGGLAILKKIEQQDYNVLARRPSVSKFDRACLLVSTLLRVAFRRA